MKMQATHSLHSEKMVCTISITSLQYMADCVGWHGYGNHQQVDKRPLGIPFGCFPIIWIRVVSKHWDDGCQNFDAFRGGFAFQDADTAFFLYRLFDGKAMLGENVRVVVCDVQPSLTDAVVQVVGSSMRRREGQGAILSIMLECYVVAHYLSLGICS